MSAELNNQILRWVEIAEEDFRLANFALKMKSNVPYRLIGFHSQQCAEKYLKAFLVSSMVDFPYTHDILLLVSLCKKKADNFNELEDDVYDLTNYAIAKRYPGYYKNVSKEEAIRAIGAAKKVRDLVLESVKNSGFDFRKIIK